MAKKKALRPRKIGKFEIAYTLQGVMCDCIYPYMKTANMINNYVWEQSEIFTDTLEYVGYQGTSGGNSRIFLKSLNSKKQYCMFMSDFDDIIKEKRFIDNKVIGSFCFCKKGSHQGIRLLLEQP